MKEILQNTLAQWHEVVKNANLVLLDTILDEQVVFHSPVVWTPQKGKALAKMYLTGAKYVLGTDKFHYTREVLEGNKAVLEFRTQIDEIVVEGIDFIEINQEGKITDFKVMVRPLKAIHILQQKMAEILEKFKSGAF